MQITSQDEYDNDNRNHDPIITQADQAQQREPPIPQADRAEPMDPLRRLGLELLRQAIDDLKGREYKSKEPDPDPAKWIRGETEGMMDVEEACKVAGVSLNRYRERARSIIRSANGPLSERDYATQEELDADSHEWRPISEIDLNDNLISKWANHGRVTALKVYPRHWRIRVDEKLREEVEEYREYRKARGVEIPPLGELL